MGGKNSKLIRFFGSAISQGTLVLITFGFEWAVGTHFDVVGLLLLGLGDSLLLTRRHGLAVDDDVDEQRDKRDEDEEDDK